MASRLEQTLQFHDLTQQENELIRRRNALLRDCGVSMVNSRAEEPADPRAIELVYDVLNQGPPRTPPPRRRPWYRVPGRNIRKTALAPLKKIRRALEKHRQRRYLDKTWDVPSIADGSMAEVYAEVQRMKAYINHPLNVQHMFEDDTTSSMSQHSEYHVPDYNTFALPMRVLPQYYGNDGAAASRIPWLNELNASFRECQRKYKNLAQVKAGMVAEINQKLEDLDEVTKEANRLKRQRDAVVRATNMKSIINVLRPMEENIDVLEDELEPVRHPRRRRPWYSAPAHNIRKTAVQPVDKIRRALVKRRLKRLRMMKWVVPDYADKELAEAYKDWEWYRVQDLFDSATPRQLKKLLKDPYYRAYYDGEISFWGV